MPGRARSLSFFAPGQVLSISIRRRAAESTSAAADATAIAAAAIIACAAVAPHALVATRAKSLAAFARENDDADIRAVLADAHGLNHFLHRERGEGVVHLRAVDADFGNAARLREEDFAELLDGRPVHR